MSASMNLPYTHGVHNNEKPMCSEYNDWLLCRENVSTFSRHVILYNIDYGLGGFDPYNYQKVLFNRIINDRLTIMNNPRCCGKTATIIVSILHSLIFNKNKRIGVFGCDVGRSLDLIQCIQDVYDRLPYEFKEGVHLSNRSEFELVNGSSVKLIKTNDFNSSLYNDMFDQIYGDEIAFINDRSWKYLWDWMRFEIDSNKNLKVVLFSTPNGDNHFKQLWDDSLRGENEFRPFSINWDDVPKHGLEWKAHMIRVIGIKNWRQEHEKDFNP